MKKKDYLSKEYKLKIGGNIRKWRNLKAVKQKELAVVLGLSESAVSNIENNITDITLSQLEDISQGLDISIEQLFTDPQSTMSTQSAISNRQSEGQPVFEKELLGAVINSMQKKDEQLQAIMQNMLHTMATLMGGGGNRQTGIGNTK